MKTFLGFLIFVISFKLLVANLPNSTDVPSTKHMYTRRSTTTTTKSPEDIERLNQLIESWTNPRPPFTEKINLTIPEYAYWTSLTKFVIVGGKLQPTYVERFCQCTNPLVKRSLITRVKRQGTQMPDDRRVRKEWRRMSTKDKRAFFTHFNNLGVVRQNETKSRLQILADFHRKKESPGAHGGPAFLPWHREFLYRLENALQDDGYSGGLPYWNSGLDHGLKKPYQSAIFTAKELGTSNGAVKRPLNADIITGDCSSGSKAVLRFAADSPKDDLFDRNKRNSLPWRAKYENFSKQLEFEHQPVHTWFGPGSHMNDFNCVGFEPMFYLHHAYVDYLWELYREKQTEKQKENDYPRGLGVEAIHQPYGDMKPFDDKENIDGLKIQYTNVLYRYEKSPDKCKSDKACRSKLLWCNAGLCQGKIQPGGQCDRNLLDVQCYCPKRKPVCMIGPPSLCQCQT